MMVEVNEIIINNGIPKVIKNEFSEYQGYKSVIVQIEINKVLLMDTQSHRQRQFVGAIKTKWCLYGKSSI